MIIQPYLLAHKLVPQPTWGGAYIVSFKGLTEESLKQMIIGQSYELACDSSLSTVKRSTELPVEIANASDGKTQEVVGAGHTLFPLQKLIDENPEAVLGKSAIERYGKTMQILIKFTQAKGNSFQVHVRPGVVVGQWKAKPESWYFFEKGKVTLGLKSPIQIDAYKQVCKEVETKANELSAKIKAGTVSLADGKNELATFIASHNPLQYVNELVVDKNTLIDLSEGGIHHSWEEGSEIPDGNIVYEVQVNVMDKECTLRSFDKGKINDDGSLRPIHIDDYFAALDSDEARNNPTAHMGKRVDLSDGGTKTTRIFETLQYNTLELEFAREYEGLHTRPGDDNSFHHLFVKEGSVDLSTQQGFLHLEKGSSVFVPASIPSYKLLTSQTATVIKTWV
jgi:mannose-6-phosphate isomerase class I